MHTGGSKSSFPRLGTVFKSWGTKAKKVPKGSAKKAKLEVDNGNIGTPAPARPVDALSEAGSFSSPWESSEFDFPSNLEHPPEEGDSDNVEPPSPDESSSASASSFNMNLRRWKDECASYYMPALFTRSAAPVSQRCSSCAKAISHPHQCQSCLCTSTLCTPCLLSTHRQTPTHTIRTWNGQFWEDDSLSKLGLVIYLGHQGGICPKATSSVNIWVGDLCGFETVTVYFCRCSNAPPGPIGVQLLELDIFPCTDTSPESGFTIPLLRQFAVFSTLGKGSAHKFYAILERATKPGFPGSVLDRSRELLLAHRRFSILLSRKRSGQSFPQHPNPAFEDDLTIRCPACPNPGINFEDDEIQELERAFFRFWMSYDGNFRNPRKSKAVDQGDISFTDGEMYYVEQQPYKEWINAGAGSEPSTNKNRPECDNHKAAQDKFVRWGGLDVTGVGAFTCARHSTFIARAFVDFMKGERFAYGDYAFASAVKWLSKHGHLAYGLTYDIWCHWIVKMRERTQHLPPEIALPEDLDLVGGLPKFHLPGHRNVCWVRYSLNNMPYVGRMEGEGIERAWAHLNETSGSTSEKSPGARWDSINFILGDWNFEKTIRMAVFLRSKFREAKRMFPRQKFVFDQLDQSLPTDLTQSWRTVSTEPVEVSPGKWTSPFQQTELTAGKFQEVITKEAANEQNLELGVPSAPVGVSRRNGVVKWLSVGIELEYSMEQLRREVKDLGPNPTPRQHDYLNNRRKALNNRINSHRTKQIIYMGDIGPPNHPDLPSVDSADPEHSLLGLPSSYDRDTLRGQSLNGITEIELKLRRALCDDNLHFVRDLLGAKAYLLKFKRLNLRGEGVTTRAEAELKDHAERVSRTQWRYNNSRSALLRLSTNSSDIAKYRLMRQEDVKELRLYLERDAIGLGQGYAAISWIWRSIAAPNEDGWQITALKTEWFRARQRYLQWEEELKILKREMVMTIRDFTVRSEIWAWKAKSQDSSSLKTVESGMAAYAGRKSWFYQRLREEALDICLPLIQDPIVEFEWATRWASTVSFDRSEKDRVSLPKMPKMRLPEQPWEGIENLVFENCINGQTVIPMNSAKPRAGGRGIRKKPLPKSKPVIVSSDDEDPTQLLPAMAGLNEASPPTRKNPALQKSDKAKGKRPLIPSDSDERATLAARRGRPKVPRNSTSEESTSEYEPSPEPTSRHPSENEGAGPSNWGGRALRYDTQVGSGGAARHAARQGITAKKSPTVSKRPSPQKKLVAVVEL